MAEQTQEHTRRDPRSESGPVYDTLRATAARTAKVAPGYRTFLNTIYRVHGEKPMTKEEFALQMDGMIADAEQHRAEWAQQRRERRDERREVRQKRRQQREQVRQERREDRVDAAARRAAEREVAREMQQEAGAQRQRQKPGSRGSKDLFGGNRDRSRKQSAEDRERAERARHRRRWYASAEDEAAYAEAEAEPIEPEVVEDPHGPGDHRSYEERVRERHEEKAREFFGPKAWEAKKARDEQREQDRIRLEADAAVDEHERSEREELLRLRSATREAQDKYLDDLRRGDFFVPGFTEEKQKQEQAQQKIDGMHRMHNAMMMQACLMPLARGVSPGSVIQTVGMMTAMSLLNKDFRDETVGKVAGPLREKVQERIDAKTMKKAMKADAKGKDLGGKWQRRLEDLETRRRGRELYTPESAALTEIGLMENAYDKMREPGITEERRAEIMDSYQKMRDDLRGKFAEDGLSAEEVLAHKRTIAGKLMDENPRMRAMMVGTAYGSAVKAPPHEVRIAGTDRVRTVWSGEFTDQFGHRQDAVSNDSEAFELRGHWDEATHREVAAGTIHDALSEAMLDKDPARVAETLESYVVAFNAQQAGLDTRGTPAHVERRLEQTETMLMTMDSDGLGGKDRQRVFSNAVVDAMERTSAEHGDELNRRLTAHLGPNWTDQLRRMAEHPEAFYDEMHARARQAEREQARAQQHQGEWAQAYEEPGAEQQAEDRQPA